MTPADTSRGDSITVHTDLLQGSQEWFDARLGMLTASTMKHFFTPIMKPAKNDKTRGAIHELTTQRVSGFIEAGWSSDDTERGHQDEIDALGLYSRTWARVQVVGFIVNHSLGFDIGYSPDGLVGDEGLIEIKSRIQKWQVKTIIDSALGDEIPSEHVVQLQVGLFVSGRKWCDYVSYCAGMPMIAIRVHRNEDMIARIIECATDAENEIAKNVSAYLTKIATMRKIDTIRKEREFY